MTAFRLHTYFTGAERENQNGINLSRAGCRPEEGTLK